MAADSPTRSVTPGTLGQYPPMLTRGQLREILQVKNGTIARMVTEGLIRPIKLGSGRSAPVRFSRDDLMNALGLGTPAAIVHRRRKAATAELHLVQAMTGGAG